MLASTYRCMSGCYLRAAPGDGNRADSEGWRGAGHSGIAEAVAAGLWRDRPEADTVSEGDRDDSVQPWHWRRSGRHQSNFEASLEARVISVVQHWFVSVITRRLCAMAQGTTSRCHSCTYPNCLSHKIWRCSPRVRSISSVVQWARSRR